MHMKEIRIPHIKQVNITLHQNGDRPASVACCGGWAKRSQRSRILSLNIEVELNARTINRLLEYLSCGEQHFNLEIHSKAEVGPATVKLFLNCRTENIECKFGPPPAAGSDTVRYCFKIRTEQDAFRTNAEPLGAGGNKKEPKARNQRSSASVFRTSRARSVSVRQ
jgi:hypothetical protein